MLEGNVTQQDFSFIGEGIVYYARAYGSTDSYVDLGNVDELGLAFAIEKKELKNFRGGGNRNVRESVNSISSAISMYDLTAGNLALVTNSVITDVVDTAITAEACTAGGQEGELIAFRYMPDLSKAITVKTAADVELKQGVDYDLTKHGITSKGAKITAAGVLVDYTPLKSTALYMLAGSAQTLELMIMGLNDAQSGTPYTVRIHKAKFGLTQSLPFFSQEYAKLQATIEVLADDTKTGSGISKFCEMQLAA